MSELYYNFTVFWIFLFRNIKVAGHFDSYNMDTWISEREM